MIKRIAALFLVVLMSIDSLAAIVSDNDGSAFVTKREFEALKKDFADQVVNYNKSIDGKIDGSISSYLAGIKLANKVSLTDEIKAARDDNEDNTSFVSWRTPQSTNHVADVNAAFYMSLAYGCGPRQNNRIHGYHILSNVDASGNLKYKKYNGDDNTGGSSDFISAYYFVRFPFATLDHDHYISTGNVTDWYLVTVSRKRLYFTLTTKYNGLGNTYVSPSTTPWYDTLGHRLKIFSTDYSLYDRTKNGPGTVDWSASVSTLPFLFNRECAPNSQIEHVWSDRSSSDANNNNFLNYNLSGTIPDATTYCVDYNFRNRYNDGYTHDCRIQKNVPSTTSHYGGNSCSAIVAWYWDGTTDTSWNAASGQYEAVNDVEFWFRWNIQKPYSLNWTKLTNKYYDGRLGVAHYKYYGIPICRTTNKVGKVKFKLLFTNTRSDSGNPLAFTYQIMDKTFPNDAMPIELKEGEDNHVLKRETISAGNATKEIEIEIEKTKIWDTTNGDYLYIKVEPSASTQKVEVETLGSIAYTEEG